MDHIFDFCLKAICKESEKCQVFFNKETCKINNSRDEKFDIPANRLAYLYKFGIFNTYFFKTCFLNFAKDSKFSNIVDQIASSKIICSLSIGPGTDIIGLLFAFKILNKTFCEDVNFKIISKNGSWRNSVQAFISLNSSTTPIIGNFKLLECDIIKLISPKANNILKTADVILMDHVFQSQKIKKDIINKTLKVIVQTLKPNAYIILVDTKTTVSLFNSLLTYGHFIYGPTEFEVDSLPCGKQVIQIIGIEPTRTGKSSFGIWVKSSMPEDIILDKAMSINVVNAKKKSESSEQNDFSYLSKHCSFVSPVSLDMPILSSTPIEKICNETIAVSDVSMSSTSLVKNINSSKINITEAIPNPKPIKICYDRETLLSLNKCYPKITLNKNVPLRTTNKSKNCNSIPPSYLEVPSLSSAPTGKICGKTTVVSDTSMSSIPISKDKDHLSKSNNHSMNSQSNINTLIKSIDSLLLKFEYFLDSGRLFNQVNQSSCESHSKNMSYHHTCHCSYSCKRICACKNNTTNSVQMINQEEIKRGDCSFNYTHCNTHIIIPLQNLSPETIAQIVSLAAKTINN